MSELNEQELQNLYAWIDDVPLTRQKKNIARDFSDGGNTGCCNIILMEICCSYGS